MHTDKSFPKRYEVFFSTAAVAAQASSSEAGFRQRDFKFIIDLFINWSHLQTTKEAPQIQNTQISRYLEELVRDGYARHVRRLKPPFYRLTRTGLLELVSRSVQSRSFPERTHFFFLYFFIKNYKRRIEELVKAEGKLFPYSLRVELTALLDENALLDAEIDHARLELERNAERIRSAKDSAQFIQEALAENRLFPEIVGDLERLFPYELNSQKPLSELLSQIDPAHQRWELYEGALLRAQEIWEPGDSLLRAYLSELERLRKPQRDGCSF